MAAMTIKSLLARFVIVLLCACAVEAQTKPDRELSGFIGPVHSVRTEEAKVMGGTGQQSDAARVLRELIVFDERGNAAEQTVYKPDGSLQWKLSWARVYDAKGRETGLSYYNADHVLTSRGVFKYDEEGRAVEKTLYSPRGPVNHVEAYAYDDKGNNINEIHRNPDGTVQITIVRGYGEQGRLTEEIFYDAQGSVMRKSVFTYDAHGNQTGWVVYQKNGSSMQMRRKSLGYDAKGNVIESVNYDKDDSVTSRETFTYVFDARGNWTQKTTVRDIFKGGTPSTESVVIYRTISYF